MQHQVLGDNHTKYFLQTMDEKGTMPAIFEMLSTEAMCNMNF